MKTIRYWTAHPEWQPAIWLNNFQLSSAEFEFVFDSKNPDYLFVTEHIFTDHIKRKRFKRLFDVNRVLVFYAGECIFPDMNIFDYAVIFDRELSFGDRIVRRPPVSFVANLFSLNLFKNKLSNPLDELHGKSGFCNFIYSNPDAHPRRDQIFRALSRYKKVDSLGPHLNNVGNIPSRTAENWGDVLVEMKRPYKFSIAAENAKYPGYITEKLVSSFLAHTVPIYWGAPGSVKEFNPDSFVDASGMSDEELVDMVRMIDSDDALWLKMVSAFPMTPSQLLTYQTADQSYSAFCRNIFEQELHAAKRAPVGYWTDNYKRYFMAAKGVSYSARRRMLSCFGRETEIVDKALSAIGRFFRL